MTEENSIHEANSIMKQLGASKSKNAVVPCDGSFHLPHSSSIQRRQISFFAAFRVFGIPMLFVALVAVVWTTWLIILTIAPNATANYLMNTGEFDNGSFWLIIDPESVLMAFSVCGLSFVVIGYMLVLSRMTVRRQVFVNRLLHKSESWIHQFWSRSSLKKAAERSKIPPLWADLTGFHGRYRKLWVYVHIGLALILYLIVGVA